MGQVVRLPANEAERLLAVRALNAASRSPTPELAALAELARGVFGTPFAAINIIDEDWQRIAGQAGMQLAECSRDNSLRGREVAQVTHPVLAKVIRRDIGDDRRVCSAHRKSAAKNAAARRLEHRGVHTRVA